MRRNPTFFVVVSAVLVCLAPMQAADDIDALIKALADGDKEARIEALDAMRDLGSEAATAVPALTKLLGDADSTVRWHAARTLATIGPAASAAVPELTAALSDDDAANRAYAAFALGRIGKPAEPAVEKLTNTVFDTDAIVRRASLRALRAIDPPQEVVLPMVLKILEQGDNPIIMAALQTLAEEGREAVPRLRNAMKNEKARYWACVALAEIGPEAVEAVPELTQAIQDKNPDVRLQAMLTLGEIGEGAKAAGPAILGVFETEDFEQVRYAAVYALGKIKATGAANGALRRALESDDEFLRTLSAWALARSNPNDKALVDRAVRMIVDAFKSDDVHVRRAAARAVIEFDVDTDLVAPLLVEALEDSDPTVVGNAIQALAAFGPKALEHVDDALSNKDLRGLAVALIAQIGPEAASAVPAIIDVIEAGAADEADAEFLRELQLAMGEIGPAASPAVPALAKSLSSDEPKIQASAAYALGKIGPAAKAAVPRLRQNLRSDDLVVKLTSITALLRIQPNQRRALGAIAGPILIKALSDDRDLVRVEAASALGEISELGKRAIPELKKLLDDESEFVRKAAEIALQKLEG